MSTRILITGASGFIGAHVAGLAVRRGLEVHALGRSPIPAAKRTWSADLRDLTALRRVVAEVRPRAIVHLAAGGVAYGTGSVSDLLAVNTLASTVLVEASGELAEPAPVIMAGSGFEYRPQERPHREDDALGSTSPYALSKIAAVEAARLLSGKVSVTVLRLFGVYGPGERPPRIVPAVVESARRGCPIELTSGEQVRDYAYVGDVAEAFLRFVELDPSPGLRVVNVGAGVPVPLRVMVEALAGALARKGVEAQLRFGAKAQRADERSVYAPDISLLRETLGWGPSTPLDEGLERTVEAMLVQPE
ncbi:MAG: NAD(P)-dependent oxidoreductase [Anaeromyxobacter sp.]